MEFDKDAPTVSKVYLDYDEEFVGFRIKAIVADDLSGVNQVWGTIKRPDGPSTTFGLSPSVESGEYVYFWKLDQYSAPGTWELTGITTEDNAGNYKSNHDLSKVIIEGSLTIPNSTVIRGNSLYTIVDGPSWTQAEANSVKLGGNLVTINDVQENGFLLTGYERAIKKLGGDGFYWLGMQDSDDDGTYSWSSSESSDFSSWFDGEPSGGDVYGPENYGFTINFLDGDQSEWQNGYWYDTTLDGNGRIHKGISETPFIRRGDSAYVIVSGPTWEEAEANAVKLSGHLVTINDAAENDWLHEFANIQANPQIDNQSTKFYWTGLNDAQIEGDWRWSSGEPFSYANWAQGEPNNANPSLNGEDFVDLGMKANKQWNDFASQGIIIAGANELSRHLGIAEIKLAPNNAPTGTPTVTGTFKVGSTLTIDATAIKDSDNFTGYTPTFKYNWETSTDGTTWSELISTDGADNNNTYILTAAESSKKIRGVVSYLDGYGTNEVVNSAASESIANVTPTYALTPSLATINEGAVLTSTVTTTNVATGTKLYYALSGTGITTSDFSAGALTGEVITDSTGKFIFTHTLANDLTTEGAETLNIKLFTDSARTVQVGTTATVSVVDSSAETAASPVVDQSQPYSNGGESARTLDFYQTSQSFTAGITGTLAGFKFAFFTGITNSSVFTVFVYQGPTLLGQKNETPSGGYFDLTSLGIAQTKGAMYRIAIYPLSGVADPYGVNNYMNTVGTGDQYTSGSGGNNYAGGYDYQFWSYVIPAATIKAPTDITLTPSSSTINEGAVLTSTVTTTNVATGTKFYYALSGTGITTADFSAGALTGEGSTDATGKFSFTHTLANDLTTEGAETVELKLFSDEVRKVQVGSTASVSIADTSTTPQPQVSVIATAYGKETDGSPAVFTFTRTGSTAGALSVNYQLFGTAQAGSDYTGNTSGSVSFAAGSSVATLSLPALADGALIDPYETIIARINPGANYGITTGKQFATATITAEGMVVVPKGQNLVRASSGEFQSYGAFAALKRDGTVVCWGLSNIGGSAPSGLSGVSQIFSNEYGFAVLKSDGSVIVWGDSRISSSAPMGLTGVIQIFSSRGAFAALKNDGSVISWGLVDGNTISSPAGLTGVSQIFSNFHAFAALKSDGTVTCWGDSSYGSSSPAELTGVSQIFSTAHAFAALKSDGSVFSWGKTDWGKRDITTPAELTGVSQIVSALSAFAALKSDGTVVSWGRDLHTQQETVVPAGLTDVSQVLSTFNAFAALKTDSSVISWGSYWAGDKAATITTPEGLTGVSQIFSNEGAFVALKIDGSIVCWGDPGYGGGSAPAGLTGVTQIFSTYGAFAALKSDGSVVSWGGGFSAPAGLTGVSQIFSSGYAFAALMSDGSVVSWGNKDSGGSAPAGLTGVVGFANPYTDDRLEIAAAPTYTLTPSATSINEGSTLTTSVATTDVASGTTLYYSLSGTGITSADFSAGALIGEGVTDATGKFTFTHTLANDLTTEGAESLSIKLYSDTARTLQVGSTATVSIIDTSITPTSGLLWSTPVATATNDSAGRLSISGQQIVVGESKSAAEGVWGIAVVEAFNRVSGLSQWQVNFGSADKTYIGAVAHAPDGTIFVTGGTREALNGQSYGGAADGWISKISNAGQVLWTKNFSNHLDDDFSNLVVDSQGNAYMAGTISRFGYKSGSGHYMSDYNNLGGDQSYGGSNFTGNWMSAIRKIDANGNNVWTRVDGSFNSGGAGLAIDPGLRVIKSSYTFASVNGQPVITGRDNGNGSNVCDYLISYKLDGTVEWTKMKAQVTALAVDPNTHYLYIGNQNSLEKLDQAGNVVWSKSLGSFAQDIAVDSVGVIHVITQNGANGLRETTWSPDGISTGSIDYSASGALSPGDLQVSADGTRYLTGTISSGVLNGGDDIAQGAKDGVVWAYGSTSATPTYTLTPSAATINEGAVLTSTVATTNVTTGTKLYYSLSGTGITTADFSAGALTGEGITDATGKFSFSHNLANDLTTEGAETLNIKLFTDSARTAQVGSTATVSIVDLSTTPAPTYTLTPSAATINEGAVLTNTVATSNVANGTKFYYALSGTGITTADFSSGALTGEGSTDATGKFTFTHTLANDLTTEGAESLVIKLHSDPALTFQVASTASVTINDTSITSVSPTQQVYTSKAAFSVSQDGTITLPLIYSTSDGQRLSGIVLNIHYNSSLLTPFGANSGFTRQVTASVVGASIVDDINDLDGDVQTDKIVRLVLVTFDSSFPSTATLPATLGTETFKTTLAFGNLIANSSSTIRFSAQETAAGYSFLPSFTTIVSNIAPTAISLSASSFNENIAAGTAVAILSSLDPDAANTFSYSLIAGAGSTDNAAFTIAGDQLKINSSPNYEGKSSYSIRLQTTDQGGLSFEREVVLSVLDLNEAPTAISISASGFNENIAAGTAIATLSCLDPDAVDTFTYSLISGNGDTDNNSFSISSDILLINNSPDYEGKSSYSVRTQSKDQGGLTIEKEFIFSVKDINDAPKINASLPLQTINRGTTFSYILPANLFSDQDSILTISAKTATGAALPSWLTFNATTGTFTGTPTAAGTFNLAVAAADELGSVSAPLSLNVREIQSVSSSTSDIRYQRNKDVTVPINYSTSDGSQTTGLSFKVHYNSALFSFDPLTGVSNKATADLFQIGATQQDTANTDNDATTDSFIPINIASFSGKFPTTEVPIKLADLIFKSLDKPIDPITGLKDTSINFTETEAASGYGFTATSASLKPLSFSLDVDRDGKVTALGDGLMIIRKLFGAAFAGDALINKAISPDSTYLNGIAYNTLTTQQKADVAAQVHANIQEGIDSKMLDVDKDGKTTALGDGLMVIRHLFGAAFAGAALTNKAISPDSPYFGPPANFAAVAANIDAMRPV